MRDALTLVWPGGEDSFRLNIATLRAIEQRSNAGLAVILTRLLSGTWYLDDVYSVIRLGLIGGGMSEKDAQLKMELALETHSLYALTIVAAHILQHFIMWEEHDDQPGELQEVQENPISENPSQTEEPDGVVS